MRLRGPTTQSDDSVVISAACSLDFAVAFLRINPPLNASARGLGLTANLRSLRRHRHDRLQSRGARVAIVSLRARRVIADEQRFFCITAHDMRAANCAQSFESSEIKADDVSEEHAQHRLRAGLVHMLAPWTASAHEGEVECVGRD